jgi:hypothetical protein
MNTSKSTYIPDDKSLFFFRLSDAWQKKSGVRDNRFLVRYISSGGRGNADQQTLKANPSQTEKSLNGCIPPHSSCLDFPRGNQSDYFPGII